ncbi:MAG: hypothetical protein DMG93_01230 [Acidobacteria bacterium]|nr:MAG: hypothetical protein DMG93_01230 [Acidobacteriota bacterium]
MKYAIILLWLTSFVLAQGAPSSTSDENPPAEQNSSSLSTDQANVAKAKTILNQGIQALGGQAYLTWQELSQEGRAYSFHHGEANSLGTLFWRFKKYPDKERVELTKKRDVVEIFNGDKGYEVTYKGARNMDPKDELDPYMRRHHYALEIVLREWLNQPGIALFYEGQTVAAQKETDQVTVMNSKNEAVTLNFDVNSHLPVKKKFTWRDPTDKERNVEEEIFDNYRMVQNIMTPFDVTRIYNGEMAAQSFLTSASYNQPVNDNLFDPHATPEKRK